MGTSCSGCSTSFLNVEGVPLVDILTEYTNVIFHPDISLATGHQVTGNFRKKQMHMKTFYLYLKVLFQQQCHMLV